MIQCNNGIWAQAWGIMIVHEDEIYNDSDEQIQTWGPEIGMFIFRIIQ